MAFLAQPILSNDINGEFEVYQSLFELLDTMRMIEMDEPAGACSPSAKFIACEHTETLEMTRTMDHVIKRTQLVLDDLATSCSSDFQKRLQEIMAKIQRQFAKVNYISTSAIVSETEENGTPESGLGRPGMSNSSPATKDSVVARYICPWPVEAWDKDRVQNKKCLVKMCLMLAKNRNLVKIQFLADFFRKTKI